MANVTAEAGVSSDLRNSLNLISANHAVATVLVLVISLILFAGSKLYTARKVFPKLREDGLVSAEFSTVTVQVKHSRPGYKHYS